MKNGGTIQVGKQANIVLSEGDIFDMMSSKVEMAWIEGRQITLDNHQKALYRKYSKKIGIEIK